ncbi:solute carrier organic anion transporter family member 2A1-like [Asterias amurensis]|uniref:solute carrier organic anion transporter family member 2A1-like n=1 Tax=Asterias amurensis TaxID=7602 RepID=UPI003AB7C82F
MTVDNETKNGYHPVQNGDNITAGDKTKKQMVSDEEAYRDDQLKQEEKCCCGFMQRLASPYLFGVLVCSLYFIQAAAFASNGGGVLSTIERRFQLKTSELAPFLIANDIMSVILVLFVTYYGHTSHRPRLIGGGGFLVGVGLLLCTLPQFIYDTPPQFTSKQVGMENNTTPSAGGETYQVCQIADDTMGGESHEVCTEEEERNSGSLMWQVSWIIIGQLLTGIGTSPISPLSVTYMDDSLKRTSTSVYVACMFISSSLGSLCGFTISGFCLSINADFLKGTVFTTPGEPNWLGAWWLTYAITGVLTIAVSIPIMMFPKKMHPKKKEADDGLEKEGQEQNGIGSLYRLNAHNEGKGICASLKGFLSAIRRLVTNLTFMSLILGVCAFLFSMMGGFVFMAKYIETQFSVSAAMAPMIFGIMMAPGSLFGNLIGGFVVKKLKLTKKGMARMVVVLKPFSLVFIIMFFFIGCENRDIAGITVNYPTSNRTTVDLPNLNANCNADCACPSDYTPVCGSDGVTYATPCHAGCLATMEEVLGGEVDTMNVTMYTNCSCITGVDSDGVFHHTAVPGECPKECNSLVPFVALSMVSALLATIMGNPGFMLQLRTVHDDDRSIAVGFTSLLLRLFGFIPSPIVFGSAIQTACIFLQSSCGKTGNCLVYDIVHFRYTLMGLTFGFECLATVAFAVCYFSIKEDKQPEAEGFQPMQEVNGRDGTTFSDHGEDEDNDLELEFKQSGV